MTQASVASSPGTAGPAIPPPAGVDAPDRSRGAVTLWFFAFTAMLLVLVSLQSLGLVVRSGAIDSWVRVIIGVPIVGAAAIALTALAYVYTLGRSSGIFPSADHHAEVQDPDVADGLVVSPTVPPRIAVPARRRAPQQRRSASRQARAIAAVAAERDAASPTRWGGAPTAVMRPRPRGPARAATRDLGIERRGLPSAPMLAIRIPTHRPAGAARTVRGVPYRSGPRPTPGVHLAPAN